MKTMRSSTTAEGPGSNPAKVFFWIGVLFFVLGVAIGLGFLGSALFASPEFRAFSIPMGLGFLLIFGGIGAFFARIGYRQLHAEDGPLAEGASYFGKIFSYGEDSRILMNGQPCLVLNVRYLRNGQVVQSSVNTNSIDASKYPIGATVEIRVSGSQAALVPGSVSDMRLEQENDLMNPDFDALGTASSLGVTCPHCGANIAVPYGMSRFCPYCDTKVSLTEDGQVIG